MQRFIFSLLLCSFAIQKSQAGMEMAIVYPFKGHSWKSGTQAVVKWSTKHTEGPDPKTIRLRLLTGDENDGYMIAPLADDVDASLGAIAFEVPEVPHNVDLYWIQLFSPEDPSNYKYSHKIEVNGTGPALTAKEIKKRQEAERAEYRKNHSKGSSKNSGNSRFTIAFPVLVVPALLFSLLFA